MTASKVRQVQQLPVEGPVLVATHNLWSLCFKFTCMYVLEICPHHIVATGFSVQEGAVPAWE